jgi:hypothetical protein
MSRKPKAEPVEVFPGANRFIELYNLDVSFNRMADDPQLRETLFAKIDSQRSRSFEAYYKAKILIATGAIMPRREPRERRNRTVDAVVLPDAPRESQSEARIREQRLAGAAPETPFADALAQYEAWIGAPPKERIARDVPVEMAGRQEYVVISDLHIPDQRDDLVAEVIREHKGKRLIVAGDLSDFESWSKWPQDKFAPDTLREVLAQQDAVLDLFDRQFAHTWLMLGNHDRRPWQKAQRLMGGGLRVAHGRVPPPRPRVPARRHARPPHAREAERPAHRRPPLLPPDRRLHHLPRGGLRQRDRGRRGEEPRLLQLVAARPRPLRLESVASCAQP